MSTFIPSHLISFEILVLTVVNAIQIASCLFPSLSLSTFPQIHMLCHTLCLLYYTVWIGTETIVPNNNTSLSRKEFDASSFSHIIIKAPTTELVRDVNFAVFHYIIVFSIYIADYTSYVANTFNSKNQPGVENRIAMPPDVDSKYRVSTFGF